MVKQLSPETEHELWKQQKLFKKVAFLALKCVLGGILIPTLLSDIFAERKFCSLKNPWNFCIFVELNFAVCELNQSLRELIFCGCAKIGI